MTEKTENYLSEIKKDITLERLRRTPPTVKISFGMSNGEFMNRDAMIEQVNGDTEIGKRVINIQMAYLKAFKKNFLLDD